MKKNISCLYFNDPARCSLIQILLLSYLIAELSFRFFANSHTIMLYFLDLFLFLFPIDFTSSSSKYLSSPPSFISFQTAMHLYIDLFHAFENPFSHSSTISPGMTPKAISG